MAKQLSTVGAILLVAIAAAVAIIGSGRASLGFVQVTSASMAPQIETGDLLVVRTIENSKVSVGDVITFHSSSHDGLITHRVVAAKKVAAGQRLVTQGDANNSADPWLLQPDHELQQVLHSSALAGSAWSVISNPIVRMTGLALTLSALMVMLLRMIWLRDPVYEMADHSP